MYLRVLTPTFWISRQTNVEEKFVTFFLRVLDVLLIPPQFQDRIDHVLAIVEPARPSVSNSTDTGLPAADLLPL
jgi:hypothetical protein